MTTRADIVAEARAWLNVPFHHQGYSRAGCDCIGLIAGVALHCGLPGASEWQQDPNCHNYSPQPDPRLLLTLAGRFLDAVPRDNLDLADILLMRFERDPMHFALASMVRPLYVIHALSRLGRVAEHRVDLK